MKSNSGKVSVKFFVGILTFGIILGVIGGYYFGNLDFLRKLLPWKSTSSVIIKVFPPSFADLVDKVSPAVVNITTTNMSKSRDFSEDPESPLEEFFGSDFWENFFGRKLPQQKQRSLGSGFIVSKEGYIITNAHVVEEADQINIHLGNEKTYEAEVVGRDEKTDLALIKAKTWVDFPEPVKLGNSNNLRVGDWVMAIGNPFGLDHTVTAGIVSAKGRAIGAGPSDDFIQTDASINHSNSGGPLFNIQGEVVGINTLIYTTTGGNIGIGFAVPINMAKEIMEEFIKKGRVTRGWMGVSIQDLTPELAETFGVKDIEGALITDVIPGSPADNAGLKQGDIAIECNGKKINKIQDFFRLVGKTSIGESVKLIVVRDRERKSFVVTVKEKEEARKLTPEKMGSDIGMQIEELTPEVAQNFGYPETEQGVLIFQVEPRSAADEAGLKSGDVIKEVNRKPVNSLKDYRDILKYSSLQEGILFFVNRKEGSFFVVVKEQ